MNRPTLEVADIFRRYGDTYREEAGLSLSTTQRRVMTAIETCRTAALGGHVEQCDTCGQQRIAYNSCRNRHCPKCQSLARATWVEQRTAELLNCEYFHLVFTVPAPLAAIALPKKTVVYGALFRATAETLRTIAADPQHLGAETGFFAVLHTWGKTRVHHPHLHCVVPGGGLSPDGTCWVACRPGFFLPVRVLSRLFRRVLLEQLDTAFEAGTLHFGGTLRALEDRRAWTRYLTPVRHTDWVVYAKRPFAGPQQVLDYVGRYTHRVAISNDRVRDIENDQVRFTYKDCRVDPPQAPKTMTLAATAFIRRFLLHVLPWGFHRIRYYGLLGARHRAGTLTRCRQRLGPTPSVTTPVDTMTMPPHDVRVQTETRTAVRAPVCTACGQGHFIVIERLLPHRVGSSIPDTS